MQTERMEWLQFQTDLQVAVAVADRLRAEAEEELSRVRAQVRLEEVRVRSEHSQVPGVTASPVFRCHEDS